MTAPVLAPRGAAWKKAVGTDCWVCRAEGQMAVGSASEGEET